MKYLLMTEAEFEAAMTTLAKYHRGESSVKELSKAEAACRARPVPEWAVDFSDSYGRSEEIKR